jgi:D-glycero-alpha-D-manno-heptose-7-phosphate kinase
LQLKPEIIYELENNLLLYFTATQRLSANIINEQVKNVNDNNTKSVEAMHNLKQQAHQMKDALLRGELNKIGEILEFGWKNKKDMAKSISNSLIDSIYTMALKNGATGGKISGAGGGGFMFFYCPAVTKIKVARAIETLGGNVQAFKFTQQGLVTWTI